MERLQNHTQTLKQQLVVDDSRYFINSPKFVQYTLEVCRFMTFVTTLMFLGWFVWILGLRSLLGVLL